MPKDGGGEKVGKEGRVTIKAELLDEVLKEYRGPQDIEEIFKQFKKAVLERAGDGVNPASGLRQRREQTGASNQPPKRGKRQAAIDRSRES